MPRCATATLYVDAPVDRLTTTTWCPPGWTPGPDEPWREVPWTRTLAAWSRTGPWRNGHRRGLLTIDLLPASTDRTLVTVTLRPSRRWAAAPRPADADGVVREFRSTVGHVPTQVGPRGAGTIARPARPEAPTGLTVGYSRP